MDRPPTHLQKVRNERVRHTFWKNRDLLFFPRRAGIQTASRIPGAAEQSIQHTGPLERISLYSGGDAFEIPLSILHEEPSFHKRKTAQPARLDESCNSGCQRGCRGGLGMDRA